MRFGALVARRWTTRAGLAGNVLLTAAATGLPRDSVAVPLGLELVDRSWLAERVGPLPDALVDAIDDGLRSVLGLRRVVTRASARGE